MKGQFVWIAEEEVHEATKHMDASTYFVCSPRLSEEMAELVVFAVEEHQWCSSFGEDRTDRGDGAAVDEEAQEMLAEAGVPCA